MISDFASQNGLHLNSEKTEVVKIFKSNNDKGELLHLPGHAVETIPQAVCLGYLCSGNLSARREYSPTSARLEDSSLLLAPLGVSLVSPTHSLLGKLWGNLCHPYSTLWSRDWILDEAYLELLESFQAEIGRRILKFHSQLSVHIGLSWPSTTSRILKQKLSFLCCLLTSDDDSIATRTFNTFVSQNAYNLSR